MHLLFFNPITGEPQNQLDERINRVVMLLASEPEQLRQ